MSHPLDPPVRPASAAILVRRSKPAVAVHAEAVRAALRDGRLDLTAFATRAEVTERVVRAWIEDSPVEDTWEGRLWSTAVTTTVPGWASPRAAMEDTRIP